MPGERVFQMLFSSGSRPVKAASSHSFLIGLAVRVTLALAQLGLNVVIVHEVDGHLSLGGLLPALTLLLLLLDQALLSFPGLLGGFSLGLDSLLVNLGVLKLSSVYSVVVSEEVVGEVAGVGKILSIGLDFLQLSSSHFLSSLHALKCGSNILVVI